MLNESYSLQNNVVVKLFEDLDADAVSHMRDDLESYSQLSSDIVIDLQEVNFIDSSGIGAIVFLYKRMVTKGKLVSVVGLKQQPKELFDMLLLSRTINCYDNLDNYIAQHAVDKAV